LDLNRITKLIDDSCSLPFSDLPVSGSKNQIFCSDVLDLFSQRMAWVKGAALHPWSSLTCCSGSQHIHHPSI
jgi:hypothetical protein